MKKLFVSAALSAVVAGGAMIALSTPAAAGIACNRAGDCWHTTSSYRYRPAFGITVHPDNWAWRERDARRYRWREHEGRGYWRNGLWVTF